MNVEECEREWNVCKNHGDHTGGVCGQEEKIKMKKNVYRVTFDVQETTIDFTDCVELRGRLPGQCQSRCPHGRLMHQLLGRKKEERWRRSNACNGEWPVTVVFLFTCSIFFVLSFSPSCSRQVRVLTMASDTACDLQKCDLHIWFFFFTLCKKVSHVGAAFLLLHLHHSVQMTACSFMLHTLVFALILCFLFNERERQEKFKCKKWNSFFLSLSLFSSRLAFPFSWLLWVTSPRRRYKIHLASFHSVKSGV